MKKYIIIFIVFCFFITPAQQFSISGKVIDSVNNQKLIGAQIKLFPIDRKTIADVNSEYSFDNLSSGTYVIKCLYINYKNYKDTIEFKAGGKTTVLKNIVMTPIQPTNNVSINLYRKRKILKAYADNYHPKINEPVKITIHFTSPGDHEKGRPHLGFSKQIDMEIISGDNLYQKSLSKGENVIMTIYVKFMKKKVYDFNVLFSRNIGASLTIYVGGAFRESLEVERIKRVLKNLKNSIENYKKKQIQIPINLLYKARHYKYIKSQTILTYNKYEKSIRKELEKKNTELFNKLKQELDILTQEGVKLYKFLKNQNHPPAPKGKLQGQIWQRQVRDSLF